MPGNSRRPYRRAVVPYRRNKFTRKDKIRKMAGVKPETFVEQVGKGVGTVAKIAKTVAGIVGMLGVEDKYLDTVLSADVTALAPYSQALNLVPQGIDFNQRTGNRIGLKHLQINMRLFLDVTATTLATNTLRVVILIDKKPQIGALTYDTVYVPNGDVTGFVDKNEAGDRVVVLKDYRTVFSGGSTRLMFKKFYIDLSRIETQYTGPSPGAFESHAIYILALSDVTGLSPAVHIRGNARCVYTDN